MPTSDDAKAGDPLAAEHELAAAVIRRAFADDVGFDGTSEAGILRFVRRARAAGWPPERALGALKTIAREVTPSRAERQRIEAVGESILRICLTAYYEERPTEPPTAR